jgi:hypothetical protein
MLDNRIHNLLEVAFDFLSQVWLKFLQLAQRLFYADDGD